MFEAIEATDWSGIPGPAVIYAPETIAPALRALASAADEASADAAIRPLQAGGLYHDHSGCVHPASLVAAPILLDIAEPFAEGLRIQPGHVLASPCHEKVS